MQKGDFFNRSINLAGDKEHSEDVVENLCSYISQGNHEERVVSIRLLSLLKAESALPLLIELLARCEQSLGTRPIPLELLDSSDRGMEVTGELCLALARYDSGRTHEVLLRISNAPGNQYVRSMAISATGIESNWHDEGLILSYLSEKRSTRLRVAAVHAIFQTSGYRLASYKSHVLPLLADASPWIVISAVEVLALLIHHDGDVLAALEPLLGDNRYCKSYHTTVARFVSSYFRK
jgi:hypothetical protein